MIRDTEEELSESEELYEKLSLVIDRGQEPLRIDKGNLERAGFFPRLSIKSPVACLVAEPKIIWIDHQAGKGDIYGALGRGGQLGNLDRNPPAWAQHQPDASGRCDAKGCGLEFIADGMTVKGNAKD